MYPRRKIPASVEQTNRLPPPLLTAGEWEEVVRELRLSPQQVRIVQFIFQGKRDKEIAAVMGLNIWTVRTHLTRIFVRLDIGDRVALVLRIFAIVHKNNNSCPKNL
jgi:DNA-binding NarL/FixJ family response regulator